jgi:O-antigen ligase
MPLLTTIARLVPLGFAMLAGGLLVLYIPFVGIVLIGILIPLENFLKIGIGELTYIWPLSIATLGAWFARLTMTGWRIRIALLPTLLLGSWGLWGIASFFWAADAGSVVYRFVTLAGFFALFLLFQNLVREEKHLRVLLVGYFAASAVFALLAVGATLSADLRRAVLTEAQNPNVLASDLGVGLLLAPYVLRQAKRRWRKVSVVLGSCVLVTAIVLTGSRGVWLGLLAAGAFAWLVTRARFLRVRSVVIAALAIALGIAGLQYTGILPDAVVTRIRSLPNQLTAVGQARWYIWAVGWEMVEANPVLGVGLGNFPVTFDNYVDAAGLRGVSAVNTGRVAHNVLLSVQSELGIVGTVLVLSLYLAILAALLRYRSDVRAFVGILVLSFVFFVGFSGTIQYRKFYWFAMSLAVAIPLVIRSESS